jgi:NAD(P)-dependent dehydrogenase (short-subunit alcohol dehydrogenase family)
MNLTNKTLIVTGASRGIGQALSLELARVGVRLVLNARTPEPLQETQARVSALGVEALSVAGDVACTQTVQALVEAARKLGNFHGFIHNAGVLNAGPLLWELQEFEWREVLDSQLLAGYQLIRYAVPQLLQAGGGVAVFLGSEAASSNLAGIGAYAVAKAALEHLARQLAAEAPQIVSFVYRPGVVETRMQQEARTAAGGGAKALHRVFRGYQEQGMLRSPQEAALALVRILTDNPRQFHGKIATF